MNDQERQDEDQGLAELRQMRQEIEELHRENLALESVAESRQGTIEIWKDSCTNQITRAKDLALQVKALKQRNAYLATDAGKAVRIAQREIAKASAAETETLQIWQDLKKALIPYVIEMNGGGCGNPVDWIHVAGDVVKTRSHILWESGERRKEIESLKADVSASRGNCADWIKRAELSEAKVGKLSQEMAVKNSQLSQATENNRILISDADKHLNRARRAEKKLKGLTRPIKSGRKKR